MRTALISGITGQDGAYLAQFLLDKGYKVIGLTRKFVSKIPSLDYLGIGDSVVKEECDLTDITSVMKVFQSYNPSEVYNLAAQSSVGLSFKQPIGTLQYNINSVLNLLESIRIYNPAIRLYQASSSEMYGKVSSLPITMDTPMHPVSPYAISKAAAHWTVINYREAYNLFVCNGVLFNHESYLRSPSFFVKKVVVEAVKMSQNPELKLVLGNLKVKRDFGYSPKYVEAMWLMLQQSTPEDFFICSGKSILLEDVVKHIFNRLNVDFSRVLIDKSLFRPTEIMDIYGDNQEAKSKLHWDYAYTFFDILDILVSEEIKNQNSIDK